MYQPLYWHIVGNLKTNHADLQIEIDEIVQDSFLLLWTKRKTLENHPNIKAWLYITSDNKLKDAVKASRIRRMRHAFSLNYTSDAGEILDSFVIQSLNNPPSIEDQAALIMEIVGDETYVILRDYYDKNISNEDLAKRYSLSRNALKMRIARLLKHIRDNFH